jgi:putative transposase
VFQRISRRIRDQINLLRARSDLVLCDLLDAKLVEAVLKEEGYRYRDRIYSPLITLWTFLNQVLSVDDCCLKAVAYLIPHRTACGLKPCSAETDSYCKARQRLPLRIVTRLVRLIAASLEQPIPKSWLWKGWAVFLVDSTTVSMPDTAKNQKMFPQPNTQAPGLGFSIARVVAIISLATGVIRDLAIGPYKGKKTDETALLRELLDRFKGGEILLEDRYSASYFGIVLLAQRGVDDLFQIHQLGKNDFRRGKRLGISDHIV